MKKFTVKFIGSAVAAVTAFGCFPQLRNIKYAFADDDIIISDESDFEFFDNGDGMTLTRCSRSVTRAEIPAKHDGKPVTEIDSNAFFASPELKTVIIPNTVTAIGENAFCDCRELAEVLIPSSVKIIDSYAFYGCQNLTSVDIPEGVTTIEWSAFAQCKNLTDVSLPSTIEKIGYNAFLDTPWLKNEYKKSSLFIVNNILFSAKETEWKPNVPSGVVKIADSAFEDSEYLRRITLPNTLEEIGSFAFSGCEYFTKIQIPESVVRIGESAFNDCIELTGITIPDSITSIEKCTFSYSGLQYIRFGENVSYIGEDALASCQSLTSVTIENPECEIFDSASTISDFPGDDSEKSFHGAVYAFPDSTAEAYAQKYNIDLRYIGDVNMDKVFNIADLVSTEKFLLGCGDPEDWEAGDRDGNHELDVYDLVLMRKQLVVSENSKNPVV